MDTIEVSNLNQWHFLFRKRHGAHHLGLRGLHYSSTRQTLMTLSRSGARSLVPNAKKKSKDEDNREEEWNSSGSKYEAPEWDLNSYKALLHGGQEVVEVMETMIKVLGDVTHLDEKSYETGLMLAAFACVGQRLEHLDGSFLMALDMMIDRATRDKDDKRKQILDIIRETTIAQVSNKSAPLLQIVSMMCHAPEKEHRREILRAAAAGGKTLPATGGEGTYTIPGGNILEVAKQANDFITDMEEKPKIPDRRLLAKLVLVREEAHDLLGGGFLDERNKPVFSNLPEAEVDFISKIIAVRPGPHIREKLENVLYGFDEGADEGESTENASEEAKKKVKEVGPVRPGMLTECLSKLINGMYNNKTAVGVTVQHLQWTYKNTLEILQEMAHGKPETKAESSDSNAQPQQEEQQQQTKGRNERYQGIWNEQEKVYRERKLSEMEIKKERQSFAMAEQKKNLELQKQEKQRVRNMKQELMQKMMREEEQEMSKPEDWGEYLTESKPVQPRRRSHLRPKA